MATPRKVSAAIGRVALPALIAMMALAWSAGTAAATGSPIRPHRSFVGAINGLTDASTISVTGCSAAGGDGRALVGQPAEVLATATGAAGTTGFTGRAHQINVDLEIPAADPMLPLIRVVHVGVLRRFQAPTFIPIFVPLPCSGAATAVFTPVAGGSAAVSARVQVTFVTPQIIASRHAVIAGTTIELIGSGFAPHAAYQVVECSQTSWVVGQKVCDTTNAVQVATAADGGFSDPFTVQTCPTPTAAAVQTCYIGFAMISGIDTEQLVGAVKITVVP